MAAGMNITSSFWHVVARVNSIKYLIKSMPTKIKIIGNAVGGQGETCLTYPELGFYSSPLSSSPGSLISDKTLGPLSYKIRS